MKNIFKSLKEFASSSFETLAIARTREALNHLPDHELKELGITREQLKNGNFYKLNKVIDLKTDSNSTADKMRELEDKQAA